MKAGFDSRNETWNPPVVSLVHFAVEWNERWLGCADNGEPIVAVSGRTACGRAWRAGPAAALAGTTTLSERDVAWNAAEVTCPACKEALGR